MSSVALKSSPSIASTPALGLELTAPRNIEIVPGTLVSVHEFEKLHESPTGQNQLLITLLETILTPDLIHSLEKKNSQRPRDLIEQDCRVAAFKICAQFDPLQGDALYKYVGSLIVLKVIALWREEGIAGERRLWSLRRKIAAITNEVSISGAPALTAPELAFHLGIETKSLSVWQRGLRLMQATHLSTTGRPGAMRGSRPVDSAPAARRLGSFDDTDSEYTDLASRLPVKGPGPSTLAEHADLRSSILSLLRPRERRVIVMTVDGYSDAEIAKELSLSMPSVSLIRTRARKRIIASGLPHLSEEERTILEKTAKMRKDTAQNRRKISSDSDHLDAVLRARFREARFPGIPVRQRALREYVASLLADAATGLPGPMPTIEHLMKRFSLSLRNVRTAVRALTPEQQEELSTLRVRRLLETSFTGIPLRQHNLREYVVSLLASAAAGLPGPMPTNEHLIKRFSLSLRHVRCAVRALTREQQKELAALRVRRLKESLFPGIPMRQGDLREYVVSLLSDAAAGLRVPMPTNEHLMKRFSLSLRNVRAAVKTLTPEQQEELSALRLRRLDEDTLRERAVVARAIRRILRKRETEECLVIPTNHDYAKKFAITVSAVAKVIQSLPSSLQKRLEFFRRGQNSRNTTYISKVTKCREYLSSLLTEVRQKNGAALLSPSHLGKQFHLSGKAVSRIIAQQWSPSERKLYVQLLRQRGIERTQQPRSTEKNDKLAKFLTGEASRLAQGLPLTHSNRETLQKLFNIGRARLNEVISKLPEPGRTALVKAFLEGRRVKTKMVGRYAEVTKWLQTEWKEYSTGKRSTVLSISAVAEQFKLKPVQIKGCISVAFHDSPETIGDREKVVKKQWRGRPANSAQNPATTDSPKCSD